MSSDHQEQQILLQCIVSDFERLATTLERAIETFARDDSGSLDFQALQRAWEAARHGAEISRKVLKRVPR